MQEPAGQSEAILPPPELVIFDCDGVLVDSERLANQVLADWLAEHGIHLTFEQTVDQFIGRSLPDCLTVIAQLLGREPPAAFVTTLEQRFRAVLKADLVAVPGVEAVLDALTVPYCVASNASRSMMRFELGHTGLLGRFTDRMYSSEDVSAPKPAPDLFLHAARDCGANPERCVVVEDTPTGVVAARAAGMQVYAFAGLTPTSRLKAAGAHDVFSSMPELPRLLDRNPD
ncbi:MAG: HAD family hydrolase [Gammaproteobacteria bacterium]